MIKVTLCIAGVAVNTPPHSWASAKETIDECLAALVRIDPENPLVVGLIHDHIGLTNWHPLKASLEALKTIGTPESFDLLKRAAVFWMPELDKKERRLVEEILKGVG